MQKRRKGSANTLVEGVKLVVLLAPCLVTHLTQADANKRRRLPPAVPRTPPDTHPPGPKPGWVGHLHATAELIKSHR
jgi:hypothetical protein